MKKYYEEMNLLKGAAILLVLLGHSILFFPINLMEVNWCKYLYDYIYSFHMPLFFLISGFFYNFNENYKVYIKSKCRRILIPYISMSILDLIPRHSLSFLINGNNSLTSDISNIIFKGGQYWFLYVLFIIFLIFPLIDKLVKIKKNYIVYLIILFIIRNINISDIFLINSIVSCSLYFTIGYLIKGLYKEDWKDKFKNKYYLFSVIGIFLILGIIPKNVIVDVAMALVGSFMMYIIIVNLKAKSFKNIFNQFGYYSLQLYLLNGFMLVPMRVICVNILGISDPLSIILIIFISNILIGILISKYILSKFKLTKYIFGLK